MAAINHTQRIYSIGHSTHSIREFLGILKNFKIELLADIRTLPGSKRFPQFDKEKLQKSLKRKRIRYIWMKDLGGLRKPIKDSLNTGWRNTSFRGYADYMQTTKFQKALEKLIRVAKKKTTVLMCAEILPWRCHRSLISDALFSRKWQIFHIFNVKTAKEHQITPFAKIKKSGRILYPKN